MKVVTPLFEANPESACQSFKNLRAAAHPHAVEGRRHCEDLWRDFAALADRNFLSEFPVRLHERWFEMYLAVSLLRSGLNVECPKPGPDVLLTVGDRRIWIEAVCATPGEPGRPDSVPERHYAKRGEKPVARRVPQSRRVLRFRNSLEGKARKYSNYLESGIVGPDDVSAIAINVYAIPGAWADMDTLMMTTLYGVGNLVIKLDRDTGAVVGREHEQLTSIVKRASGAEVGVQPFIDGSMPHIAAVLGSRSDAVNLPRRLGDDFGLFPNLTGTMKWAEGSIELGEEWSFREAEGEWKGQKTNYSNREDAQ